MSNQVDTLVVSSSDKMDQLVRQSAPAGISYGIARPGSAEFASLLGAAKTIVGWASLTQEPRFFERAPNLRLVQLLSAGYDNCDIGAAARHSVLIATNGAANAQAVAEHVFLLMLAVSRRLIWQHGNVRSGAWWGDADLMDLPIYEIGGKTLGIIGFGNIGRKVAMIAAGFSMKVLYSDVARASEHVERSLNATYVSADELLKASDYVSLSAPLTSESEHMLGRAQFSMMKPSAFVINTSRGRLIDQGALYEAITSGQIAGAGLDVFEREPEDVDNPLLSLPQVVLSPHLAGPTQDSWTRRLRNSFENARRLAANEPVQWVVPELQHLQPAQATVSPAG